VHAYNDEYAGMPPGTTSAKGQLFWFHSDAPAFRSRTRFSTHEEIADPALTDIFPDYFRTGFQRSRNRGSWKPVLAVKEPPLGCGSPPILQHGKFQSGALRSRRRLRPGIADSNNFCKQSNTAQYS